MRLNRSPAAPDNQEAAGGERQRFTRGDALGDRLPLQREVMVHETQGAKPRKTCGEEDLPGAEVTEHHSLHCRGSAEPTLTDRVRESRAYPCCDMTVAGVAFGGRLVAQPGDMDTGEEARLDFLVAANQRSMTLRMGAPNELLLERGDGASHPVHPLWLRERCKDAASMDLHTQQRLQDPSDFDLELTILALSQPAAGVFRVQVQRRPRGELQR